MSPKTALALQQSPPESPMHEKTALTEVLSSRHVQEVQAAMMVAKRFPRDETAAIVRIEQACKRQGLAEAAMYSYPKGGTKVVGPSIRLAEVLAQYWGNLDFGVLELEQRNGESDWMSFCWDLETNTRASKVFTLKHEIHKKEGPPKRLSDPRDIYELGANYAARRLRACIMAVIPGDVQELAIQQCQKTLTGSSTEPLIDRIRKMTIAFSEIGVTQAMLEARLGHLISACIEQDLVKLRSIYQSIRDGMSTREEWFDLRPAPKSGRGVEGLVERLSPNEPAYNPPTLAELAAASISLRGTVEASTTAHATAEDWAKIPPDSPLRAPIAESQTVPEVDAADGRDETQESGVRDQESGEGEQAQSEPPEPTSEQQESFWRGEMSRKNRTLADLNVMQDSIPNDPWLTAEAQKRLLSLLAQYVVGITGSRRGSRSR